MSPQEAREVLDAVIRQQLSNAWQRGVNTAPNGPNSLADGGAPRAFLVIGLAADAYAASVANTWKEKR